MDLSDVLQRPRLLAAAACFALGAATLLVGLLPRPAPAPAPLAAPLDLPPLAPADAPADEAPAAPAELVVYVTGAVPRPDVYRLAPDARVKDAVLAAGGLTADAAADQINLAEPLSDAAHVHIPALSDAPAPAATLAPAGGPAPAAGGLLDLNTASAAELEELPGIGATLAGRIVARRDEAGPFGAVEDLREVSGVGEKLYAQIAPLVTVGP